MDTALWVFGYGSLIWDPGFEVAEKRLARLAGWRRRFCMWSIHHRGTPEAPGLVLALDQAAGEHCDGVAFRVAPGQEAQALADLRARELVSAAYLERRLRVAFTEGGGGTEALVYVVDPAHVQYCGDLPEEDQAQIIARAAGGRGPNRDYLAATAMQLSALGIADPALENLADRVHAIAASDETIVRCSPAGQPLS